MNYDIIHHLITKYMLFTYIMTEKSKNRALNALIKNEEMSGEKKGSNMIKIVNIADFYYTFSIKSEGVLR